MMLNRIARVLPILGLLLIPGEPSADSIEKPPLRPLILIPGILGSSLVNSSEQFVWRGFNDLLSRFDELEYSSGSRSILHSNDIMRTDFLLGAWKTGSLRINSGNLERVGFREGKDLFIFHYDWRQSNFVTAEQLQQFITEHLNGQSFNILAHSMGGIVSLIYAHSRPSEQRVNRIVTVGTPYLGALAALDVLVNGPLHIYSIPGIRRRYDRYTVSKVILSFPSLFELLPVYDECCILEVPDPGERKELNVIDEELWFRLNLLPAEYSEARLHARIRNALAARRDIGKLVQNWPEGVEWIHIGGDYLSTPYRVRFRGFAEDYEWEPLSAGDGTVLWKSAAPNNGRIVEPTTKYHQEILEEPRVTRWIKQLVVAEAPART